ncbi:MAG TPA: phenylacetate--CoA ligase [Spirochaetia bacterium]|nr:phenylacetate--CoA ligase [Spirochaetia bacterium]
MIWNPDFEAMDRARLGCLQGERLGRLVDVLHRRVPFYRRKMEAAGVRPQDIQGIGDLARLPFTTKDEMREVYPYGLLAVSLNDIVEIHTSSGTTGTPVVDAYTAGDLEVWSEAMARTLSAGGTGRHDIVQNAYGYGLFTGGLGVHYGARRIGATVIPISGGNTKRQLAVMRDFKSTVIACTPSYSLYLAEAAREEGLDPSQAGLKAGFFGAEPWSESMRAEIQQQLGLTALDIYGLTEIIGPGVAMECECQQGLHVNEDHFFPEIIDPATGAVLPDGHKGELVITTLTKDGTPVLRYRTRDITYLDRAPCACGRTTVRMHRILGRTDDMLIIRGVNVFPSQIEEVILKVEGIEPHYQLVVDRRDQLDELEVQVEMNERLFSDEIRGLERMEKKIEADLYASLSIHTRVRLVEPKSIARSEGKAKRIIDRRQL